MSRKHLFVLLGVLALGVVAAGVTFVVWDRSRLGVTWANYERIREGMTNC